MNILIVDDDKVFLESLEKILSRDQHTIKLAYSGEEALQKLKQEYFDIILTDLKMPGISGIDFLKKLREDGINSIVIMITGYGTIETAVEAMKEGAYDYLLKPFKSQILRNKINQVEIDIKLRNYLPLKKPITKSVSKKRFSLGDIEKYNDPFLIISDQNPQEIIEYYNITIGEQIWIKKQDNANNIILMNINSVKNELKRFIEENEKGTIIIKGYEEFFNLYEWEDLKKFVSYLISEVVTKNFALVILVNEEFEFSSSSKQNLFNKSLLLFVDPIIDKIISLISHPLRKNVITLLRSEKKLNFNEIVKKLNVKHSSGLAFHINKLVSENILKKEESKYLLSSLGIYFLEVILQLEKFGYSYPQSQIQLFKLPEIS